MEPLQSTLLAYLEQVPDPRCPRGQRYARSFMLALIASALAAGQRGRLEWRTLECSTALKCYVGWPGLGQVLRRTCKRILLSTGEVQMETHYGVTDLSRTLAGPQLLEQIWRGHGTIEDRWHYVRDETLGEDRGQTHMGSAPQALAALRHGILSLLRYHGWSNIAEANRRYDACPQKALQLLGGLSP
jgi:hypothetical protein